MPSDESPLTNDTRIVFFDGECVLCNGFVDWVLNKDEGRRFRFASLQGDTAAAVRASHPEFPEGQSSIVLWDGVSAQQKSSAVLAILSELPSRWRLLAVFRFVPRVVRDLVYTWVARVRYAVFGKAESCRVPTTEERARILP